MIKILHIIQGLSLGGASRAMAAASKYQIRQGNYHHTVASLLPVDIENLRLAEKAGLDILIQPKQDELTQAIMQADIVQVEWWNNPEIYQFFQTEFPPMRLTMWCHVAGDHIPQIITSEIRDFPDRIILVSPYSYELPVIQSLPVFDRLEKAAMVYGPADFERLEGLSPKSHTGFNVGYIGTVDFVKMNPNFIPLSVSVEIPNIQFIVCGGGIQETLKEQAKILGAVDRFDFRGYVRDLRPVLEIMDVYGYPLCEDTYAASELTLQEAMFSGVPPVVFPYGGLKHLVVNDFTGLVVNSEIEYKQAIEFLYYHPDERKRLGKNARHYASEIFGAENSAKKLDKIYQQLMTCPKTNHLWGYSPNVNLIEQPVSFSDLFSPMEELNGARLFIQSLGEASSPFEISRSGVEDESVLAAEEIIASSSYLLASLNSGGIRHYSKFFPNDAHLHLWSGLVLSRQGEHNQAVDEFQKTAELGLEHWRVFFYQAGSCMECGQIYKAKELLDKVTKWNVENQPKKKFPIKVLDQIKILQEEFEKKYLEQISFVEFGTGCHIDEGNFRWLTDEAHMKIQSAVLYRPIEMNFQLQCITSNAYAIFPFETRIAVNEQVVQELVFDVENKQEFVKLILPASKSDIDISVVSTTCFIPSEHGHEDTRRLAVQLSELSVRPCENITADVQDQISMIPVDELEAAYLKLRDPKSKIFPPSNTNELIQRLNELDFNVEEFVIDVDDYHQYFQAARYSENFPDYYSFNIKEKSLEHYIAARLLKLQNQDIYIDIASQESPVPKIYNELFGVTSYRQDLKYPPGINDFTIGGDAANMPIPKEFTNKLALHCSFEHFEGDSDIRFIHEIERVLKPGGAACIVPLYLSSQYFIMTNPLIAIGQNVPFEEGALVVSNPELNSRHGRFYDPESLCTRVRQHMGNLKMRIINIKNSKEVDSSCYVRFAMVLEKGGDNDKTTTEEVFIKKADEKVTVEEIPAQRNEPVKQMPLEEWISLVEQLIAQGEIELGIYRLFDGLDQYPQEVELYQLMALLMVQTSAYRSAESMLQKALIIDPKSADLYNQLGSIFYLQGSYLQSKQAYQKALKLNPNLEDAVNNLHELDALLTKPN